ncbi:hypothetical protein J3E72DRAFT_186462 [Bipolaris maydis]|nr:hypothetical protein J3E72DRAFT_186462 [Bipolaris maydis]
MSGQQKLYLFGDQTYEVQSRLRELLQYRVNPILDDFLLKSYHAIRTNISNLPIEIRDNLPRFTSIDDLLLMELTSGKRCVPLEMALTCMYQLGVFISKAEHDYPSLENSRILGLCTGTLAAAAVSCSRSTLDLVPLGVAAVVTAFKTGIHVTNVAQRVEPSQEGQTDRSWSMLVGGTDGATEAVNKFLRETNLPLTDRPYISAVAPSGITVSGPPNALAQLTDSKHFEGIRTKSIPIYGPYHCPHLFSPDDVDEIVIDMVHQTSKRASGIPVLSTSGVFLGINDFRTLLKEAVSQILLQPISWPSIINEVQKWLYATDPASFQIVAIATTAEQLVYNALKQTSLNKLILSQPAQVESAVPEQTNGNPKQPKLAIIASSGRFPGAKDNEAFWNLLYQGLDVHREVPDFHWDAKSHVDPSGKEKNTSATPLGCWLDNPKEFDCKFFNISPREAAEVDPAQRIALMTAYEAIEQAGLVPDATPSTRRDRVGVFYGVTSNDWMETNSAQQISTYFIPGGNRAFIPGRINYFFKFSGPSYAVDTACSSSLAGIHIACNALWRGDIDTAIAGGTNVLTNPDMTAGLDRGHFLSRTGNCKTFDDDADGYCRGEGVGTVIIKRLDDAIADRDPIQAIILGAYTNHSAESDSITRPHAGAQNAIFNKILNQGAVKPYDVSYVEMHGTGTQAGDATEMSSVLDTFAPPLDQIKKPRSKEQPLYLGSAKPNIGHGEAASGVSALIKVLLMMQKNLIPPHVGIKTKINRKFPTDLDKRNVNIAREPIPWKRTGSQPRRTFVNNFSAAGGNSALLLEDAPVFEELEDTDPRTIHVLAISAKNGVSLQGNLKSMHKYLKQNPDVSLSQLSYTTTSRRMHHQHRVMLTGKNSEEMCQQIEKAIQDNAGMTRPKCAPKVLFTFTGNGAQYPGMGRELFKNFSVFRTEMRCLDRIGRNLGFPSMLPVIESAELDIGKFAPTPVQLATTCMQIALTRLWSSFGIHPAAVVGHSLGEFAALNVAGVLSDTDTVYLVGKRAQLLEAKCQVGTHSMLVVRTDLKTIYGALQDQKFEVACINSPIETVLAGPNEDITTFSAILNEAGIKSTLLKVPYAFHSSQVDPILEDFARLACGVKYSPARVPVLCPLEGRVIEKGEVFVGEYFSRHCRELVDMITALEQAQSKGYITDSTMTLEIGPHPAVSGMIKANLPKVASLPSLQRGRTACQTLTAALKSLYMGGANLRWSEYHRDFSSAQKVVQLPAYSWDLKEYWIQYINDWSLRKGDPPLLLEQKASKLESTTIHNIVEETGDAKKVHIVVEADIARKDLSPLVQGHEVDGIPLCTPSVYCDIALTLGTYLVDKYQTKQEQRLVDVGNMDISKALILNSAGNKQLLQAHADVDWTKNAASIRFMTFSSKQKLQEHARCVVRFLDRSLLTKLEAEKANIKKKMQALNECVAKETAARFNRPMVYRAIRPLARFHDDYRAIDEVILNSNTLEATSKLSFGTVKRDGHYHTHPAVIDALTQSCGFTMNCNDGTDLDKEVFMNHGWGSFQIFEPINLDKTFTTYTQMHEGKDKLWHGDVAIFDQDDKIVASFRGIAIQCVPRRVLKVILNNESRSVQPKGASAAAKAVLAEKMEPTSPNLKPTEQAKPAPAKAAAPSKALPALAIIAEESGISESELSDDTVFTDAGIDSLMGLTITARFKEELDLDIDFNSLFYEYPAVKDLKRLLGDTGSAPAAPTAEYVSENSSDSGAEVTGDFSSASSDAGTGTTTPDSASFISGQEKIATGANTKVFQSVLSIIAEESGVAVEDLTDDTDFADSGVDSLLSLVVVSRLRDELELEIQHESLFLECPTVRDLRIMLCGDTAGSDDLPPPPAVEIQDHSKPSGTPVSMRTEAQIAALPARKKAVDDLVEKYTAGFKAPASNPNGEMPAHNEKIVLVTGTSGSLGGHLAYHLANLEDVKTVICLNRENKNEKYARQYKAMREKGIRFPEELKHKLRVFQTDTTKPMLGLEKAEYESLASSVTHLIHNAWTMSAKRPLSGFESQFQVFRNLIDFGCDVVNQRPAGFKFGFQMVSSIGVVGHYQLENYRPKTGMKQIVPEERVGIDAVLTNGYGEAKWGCERMLDETLHKHPENFRTMVVRLGQIAGSKTSGYWNPMEHFGFLVKSSQTLNALPDLHGGLFWTPVNDIAGALSDLVLADNSPYPIYHIENPVGQSWTDMTKIIAEALHIDNIIAFEDWLEKVKNAPPKDNPASTLLDFLDDNFLRMSCGGLVLDCKKTLEHSPILAACGPVSSIVAQKYIQIWKEIGFLKSTEEDRANFEEIRERLWG